MGKFRCSLILWRNTMMKKLLTLAISAVIMTAAYAGAPEKGQNGGWKVDAGSKHHVEVLLNGTTTVTVYVSDENSKAIPAEGFKANATIVVNGTTHRLALDKIEGSKFIGVAPVAIPANSKGAIQLTLPSGSSVRATF
jgi:hypothetical protein